MWYVIQVKACHEHEMVNKCQSILKPGEEVFTIETERLERREGVWQPVRRITFQKYIFADIEDPDDFRLRLRKVYGMTKLLGVGDVVLPIFPEEEEHLKRLGGKDHIIGKSDVYKDGDKIKVIDGPLRGLEASVKWVDKRQKLVGVAVMMLGQGRIIKLSADFVQRV